ncbi:MAG: hypothetical protein GXY83_31290 [Rhodopirellula sp.]|nr:hypothetical protein [Rhodopirellula sp.]
MKLIVYALAVLLGFLGLVFLVGAQGQWMRIVVGLVLLVAAGALVWLARLQPSRTTVVQQIDLSGDVNLQDLNCRSCGATLNDRSVQVRAGAVFVHCEYCGAGYQLEEEPKW